jgi:hypothetical protein
MVMHVHLYPIPGEQAKGVEGLCWSGVANNDVFGFAAKDDTLTARFPKNITTK